MAIDQHDNHLITFTKDEWQNDEASEAFGVVKSVRKPKEKTPGVKAVLIFQDSFNRAKVRMREYRNFRPVVDLPEVISAMIDVCAEDADLMTRVTAHIVSRREAQLGEMKSGLDALRSS